MMVTYLRDDIRDDVKEVEDTRGRHARFIFLKRMYAHKLTTTEQTAGDNEHIMQHRAYTLRAYLTIYIHIMI